jgi:hypothetical protein
MSQRGVVALHQRIGINCDSHNNITGMYRQSFYFLPVQTVATFQFWSCFPVQPSIRLDHSTRIILFIYQGESSAVSVRECRIDAAPE